MGSKVVKKKCPGNPEHFYKIWWETEGDRTLDPQNHNLML